MKCKHDNGVCICGKGENDYCPIKPMTNDEWRRTCSAEEFAEFIVDAMVFYDGNRHAFVAEAIEMAKKKNVILACDSIYKDVVAWLKQPHG